MRCLPVLYRPGRNKLFLVAARLVSHAPKLSWGAGKLSLAEPESTPASGGKCYSHGPVVIASGRCQWEERVFISGVAEYAGGV